MGNSPSSPKSQGRPSPWRSALRSRPSRAAINGATASQRPETARPASSHQHEPNDDAPPPEETRPTHIAERADLASSPIPRLNLPESNAMTSATQDVTNSTRRSRISRARMSMTSSLLRRNRSSVMLPPTQPEHDNNAPQASAQAESNITPNTPTAPESSTTSQTNPAPSTAPTEDTNNRYSYLFPPSLPGASNSSVSSSATARELSRLTASLRRGRSRIGRRDPHADDFSHLLTIAAQATAASLTGNSPERAVEELRRAAAAMDPDDGSFDGFMQYLLSGRLGAHLARNIAANNDNRQQREETGTPRPLDFFRMFQLRGMTVSSNSDRREPRERARRTFRARRPSISRNRASSLAALEEGSAGENRELQEGTDGRSVPVLIIAIRGLSSEVGQRPREREERLPTFLDALMGQAPTFHQAADDDMNADGLRASRNAERLSQRLMERRDRRRASMGGLFSGRDLTRPGSLNIGRPRSEIGPPSGITSNTPPGPSAPPTTPASAPLSALSSGTVTPTNRPVSMSNPSLGNSTSIDESTSRAPTAPALTSTAEEPANQGDSTNLRRTQRRRSESDFMRYGSGSARRNGVVEPDHLPLDRDGNRSWIIYVLGGNYPENHPILSTPSLFTESPTYEDMLLLSSLLGPAKPPVANSEDLESAGGLFKIMRFGDMLGASAVEGEEFLPIEPTHSCGICLTGYQEDEMARRLKSCNHLFHRHCVDEWLTTGRNSCPLCRGLGVTEKVTEKVSELGPRSEESPAANATTPT